VTVLENDDEVLEVDGVVEETDATPVLAVPAAASGVTHRRLALPLVAQAAAMAVTGFAAGAVTAAVVRAVQSKKTVKPRRRAGMPAGPQIIATRSYIVDVHVLAPRD
jgi:hypothetical protein